jgi:hypothetical protein
VWKVLHSPYVLGKSTFERLAGAVLLDDFNAIRTSLLLHPFMDDHSRGNLLPCRTERRRLFRKFAFRLTAAVLGAVLYCFVLSRESDLVGVAAFCLLVFLLVLMGKSYVRLRAFNSWASYGVADTVEMIKKVIDSDSQAVGQVMRMVKSGQSFALLLRSYDLEVTQFWTDASVATPELIAAVQAEKGRRISTRFFSDDEETAEDRLSAALVGCIHPVRLHNLADWFTEFRGDNVPRICLPSNVWKEAIRELIQIAPLIVVHLVSLTPGVQFELECIIEIGKQDSTIVVICDPPERHADAKIYTAPLGVTTYDYPAVDLGSELLQRFPRVVRARDIDYSDLRNDVHFSDWFTRQGPFPQNPVTNL